MDGLIDLQAELAGSVGGAMTTTTTTTTTTTGLTPDAATYKLLGRLLSQGLRMKELRTQLFLLFRRTRPFLD